VADIISGFFANPTIQLVMLVMGVALAALSFAAAWWTYRDASRRTESTLAASIAAGWILISTPLLLPFALAVYGAVRPRMVAAEARIEALEVDLAFANQAPSCPGCSRRIEPGWVRCPMCARWLAAPCAHCGAWTDATFDICPVCGSEERLPSRADLLDVFGGVPSSVAAAGVGITTAAATGFVAAAVETARVEDQRGPRMSLSSVRPRMYASSRDNLSASS